MMQRIDRKYLLVGAGLLAALFILCVVMFAGLSVKQKNRSAVIPNVPVLELTYCNDSGVKPCVVSFGIDVNDNMWVNILVANLSVPDFYLKITYNASDNTYECQKSSVALNSVYCVGPKLPPGQLLHLVLISIRDEQLLAEGDLSIIGLAFPQVEITVSTPTPALSTQPSPVFLPSIEPSLTLSSPAKPSYPNP